MRSVVVSLILGFLFFFNASVVWASTEKYITIVNPIRGGDFFQLKDVSPKDNLEKQWLAIKERGLAATWLVRPDALQDSQILSILKTLPGSQEIGLFMEITPIWTNFARVNYRTNQNWHSAGSVFLTGYQVDEREKLIDVAFEKFKSEFGFYPKSVGAWWIDAYSLKFMKEKYGVVANMDVSDQYTTDNYQVWGQYWSVPFYPSKRNALVPAAGEDQKIGVITIQWASRDPFNAYGNGVLDSTYSVQANDYANPKYHNLTINYFNKLLEVYLDNPYSKLGQVTMGLENDFSWDQYGNEYLAQLDSVAIRKQRGSMVLRMSDFASRYRRLYPNTSGPYILYTKDPLGSGGAVLWFQNTTYRVGWFYNQMGSVIRDLRVYGNLGEEPCLNVRCDVLNLAEGEVRNIDEVTYGDKWIIDEGRISDIQVNNKDTSVEISYKNQLGNPRILKFLENDITIDNFTKTVSGLISDIAYGQLGNQKKIETHFTHQLKEDLPTVLLNQVRGLVIFILFSFFLIFMPGLVLLRKIDLTENSKFILAWPVGLSLFALWAFIFGYLHFWWGLIILPILSLVIFKKVLIIPKLNLSKINFVALFVIACGSMTWLLTVFKNGLIYDYGMGFWGPHGHDGIWHLSLIESIKQGLPVQNPIFSESALQNYHFFYDLILAATSSLTNLAAVDLYFRLFPLLISLGIGAVSYLLASRWFRSSIAGIFACFFVYFGGSFGWVISFIRDRSFGGETTFWAQQAISTLINPPFAISLLIFLAGLYLFHKIAKQKYQVVALVVPLVVLWGSLIEFKAYGGILVLGSLGIVTLVEMFKRNFQILKLSIPIFILSLLVFLPNNYGSTPLLVYSPFWLIHSMIDFPDRLNWMRLTFTRLSGFETHNYFKILGAEGLGLFIFLIGNLGTRITGIFLIKKLWPLDKFNLFIITFFGFALFLPLIFIQKGANFNIIQFFYYFVFLMGFLSAAVLSFIVKRLKRLGWVISVGIMVLTFPTSFNTLEQYIPQRPPARVSNFELEALSFLKSQPNGIVIAPPFDRFLKDRFSEPLPIFAYVSSSYISAFSAKKEFISDTINLEIIDIDYKARLQAQKDIFSFREPNVVSKILKGASIKYIYIPKAVNIKPTEERYGIKRIFDNEEVSIYGVL